LQQCCLTSTKKEKHKKIGKMGLSKEHRIMILLAIDSAFFFVELIVGMLEIEAKELNPC
jgi:Co/Zn/Cd efflux system component